MPLEYNFSIYMTLVFRYFEMYPFIELKDLEYAMGITKLKLVFHENTSSCFVLSVLSIFNLFHSRLQGLRLNHHHQTSQDTHPQPQ